MSGQWLNLEALKAEKRQQLSQFYNITPIISQQQSHVKSIINSTSNTQNKTSLTSKSNKPNSISIKKDSTATESFEINSNDVIPVLYCNSENLKSLLQQAYSSNQNHKNNNNMNNTFDIHASLYPIHTPHSSHGSLDITPPLGLDDVPHAYVIDICSTYNDSDEAYNRNIGNNNSLQIADITISIALNHPDDNYHHSQTPLSYTGSIHTERNTYSTTYTLSFQANLPLFNIKYQRILTPNPVILSTPLSEYLIGNNDTYYTNTYTPHIYTNADSHSSKSSPEESGFDRINQSKHLSCGYLIRSETNKLIPVLYTYNSLHTSTICGIWVNMTKNDMASIQTCSSYDPMRKGHNSDRLLMSHPRCWVMCMQYLGGDKRVAGRRETGLTFPLVGIYMHMHIFAIYYNHLV